MWDNIKRNLGIVVALIFIAVALMKVLSTTKEYMFASKNTLILSHWQMEDGYREGLQQVIDNYKKLKKSQGMDVNIIQTVVPWNGYAQWSITQLLGGKPVDIMEFNIDDVWIGKYFIPFDQYVNKINPYNVGTPLEGLPWKETFIDNMAGAWRGGLLGYYGVGLSTHTWRVFYNKDLLEKITGSSEPPKTFEEWLKQCKQITQYAKNNKKVIVPIIGQQLEESFFRYYAAAILYSYLDKVDVDIDGSMGPLNVYYAKKKGVFTWNDEEVKAPIMMVADLAKYFSKGFVSVDREQSKYLFSNSKAVFFPGGSWESKSMIANAPFKVGVFELPAPAPSSKYAKYYDGNVTEVKALVYGANAIPRKCKNVELAIDFLMYLTSYDQNILLNEKCMWIPSVRFAKLSKELEPFRPNTTGIPETTPWPTGGFHGYFMRTQREFMQGFSRFLLESQGEGKYTYGKFLEDLQNAYDRLAKEDTSEYLVDKLRNIERLDYNMSWLEVNEEYFKEDITKTANIAEKKKILIEGVDENERIYNLDRKTYEECF